MPLGILVLKISPVFSTNLFFDTHARYLDLKDPAFYPKISDCLGRYIICSHVPVLCGGQH
jgi:hypothetical protein